VLAARSRALGRLMGHALGRVGNPQTERSAA
jgi:hypothetical protein